MLSYADPADHHARAVDRAALPMIDLAAPDHPDRLRAACVAHGFFYVVGHGVPVAMTSAVVAEAGRLFALAEDEKQRIAKSSLNGRGFARLGGRALDGGGRAAVKQEFYVGRERPTDDPDRNRWPAGLPGFRERMLDYVEAMHALADRLMGALALSLGLPEDHFAAFCDRPIAALRLVRYPPEGAEAGAHTDFGALTILLQDDAGGLQVFDLATGGWIDATPIAGAFIVNLGDLMERWTNKRYRSTRHRVVHRPGAARISAPFFFSGAPDHPIEPLPSCLAAGDVPAFEPTTPARHLEERRLQQGF
jgi:isopenicillin N synthase-like dioxygenase